MNPRYLVIEFMDGKKKTFSFPEQASTEAAKRIGAERFLDSPYVIVETEGELILFPVANIKSLRLMGALDDRHATALPAVVIRGAEQH